MKLSDEINVCWHPGCLNELSGRDGYGRHTCEKHHNKTDPVVWFLVLPMVGGLLGMVAAVTVVATLP